VDLARLAAVNILPDFKQDLDRSLIPQIQRFWTKINERQLHFMGVPGFETYDTDGDEALGRDVEFFHFSICADARMRYLGENFVLNDDQLLDPVNKLSNAVVAHLYGGRRIYSLFTGVTDPRKAYLDFSRVGSDPDYVRMVRSNAEYAKLHGFKFYGTTELHTSLQTAARNFCRDKYGDPGRPASNVDIIEWIASWRDKGLFEALLGATSLGETFEHIKSLPGVGAYYGYHLAVDCSLFPFTRYHHDEPFCVPGGGCQTTLKMLFPRLTASKKFPFGEAVVWIEQNQKDLFPTLQFHPALWNIERDGKKVFPFEQNKLMVYGLEVGLCQFGVYCHLKKNPHLIERRKVGVDPDLTPLILREQGAPVTPEELRELQSEAAAPTATKGLLEF